MEIEREGEGKRERRRVARGEVPKPIGGRKGGHEVKRQERAREGGEREQVEVKCEDKRKEEIKK